LSKVKDHSVSAIDENHLLYGNFIGLQYVFEQGLEADTLEQAVTKLTKQFPALAGRYFAKGSKVKTTEKPSGLKIQKARVPIKDVIALSNRPTFLFQPNRKDVLRGRAPLSSFTLTEFEDGGAVFGMAVSHVLTDAAGFHHLIQHLAGIYTALQRHETPPTFPFATHLGAFNFGTQKTKAETLNALKQRGLPKPIPIKGFVGGFITSLIIKAMDKSLDENPPIAIRFTPEQVQRLKQTVLTESGEDWISTNVALCAHFTSLIAKLSYGDDLKKEMQIGQLLDLRNRYFEADSKKQSKFVGNAILIHIDKANFPKGLQNTSRGALATYFKARQARTDAKDVKTRLDLLSDCLRHGYTNPELDVKNPIISLNNQSKMKVYDISFDGRAPLKIYPQDVGDNIMFFPAANGGIEIYIRDIVNPMGQQALLTAEWEKRIFDF